MSICDEPDKNVFTDFQKQESSRKRPLCSRSYDNGADFNDLSPIKATKRMEEEHSPRKKQSTPLKRSPKIEATQALCSDFSDWDESPVKQVLSPKGLSETVCNIAEKENSEFEDSFDEPVFKCSPTKVVCINHSANLSPLKRSSALRLSVGERYITSYRPQSTISTEESDSGVSGFPSLCDSKTQVDLIVKEVKNVDGLVDLICQTENDHESVVYLQDQWAEICIEPNTRIRIIGAQKWGQSDYLVSNEHGIVIVAPDTLVPCTSIASSTWCPRKVILNDRFRGPVEANKAMLIGIIVHELFQAAMTCPDPRIVTTEWILEKWQSGLRNDVLTHLVALHFSPCQFEKELMPYVDVIVNWVQTYLPGGSFYSPNSSPFLIEKVHDIEENIWVPQMGIKGKVDVTLKVRSDGKTRLRPLELKTGKSGPSSEHAAQVMLYNLILSSRHKQPIGDGVLLYLKDGVSRDVQPRALELKGIINQRNSLAFHLSKLDPGRLPAPRSDPRFCETCDHSSMCSFYQVAMESGEQSTDIMFDFAKARMTHLSGNHLDYFKKWIRWIYCEWAEDKSRKGCSVKDLWRKSAEERESDGFCAASLRLSSYIDCSSDVSTSYSLTFESSSEIPVMVFTPGNMCTISTSEKPGLLLVPIIESTSNTITVRSEKILEKENLYHIDLYNSFSTYSTTLGSLLLLMENDQRSCHLREIIVDLRKPLGIRFDAASLPRSVQQILVEDNLNEEQCEAVRSSLLCSDYTLIEGFPGSGKTTTIVALLRCLLEMNCSVLLATNTHSALDNVLVKLSKFIDPTKILRLGKTTSGRRCVADLTLESKLNRTEDDKYKTARDILKNTPLVASTCHYVPRDVLFSWRRFDYCIIDEASMVLEPVVLPALVSANRFVLVGDAHQLTPLVQNRKCSEEGMSKSLFERLQVHTNAVHALVSQYRMNRVIASLSSRLFYDGRLLCGSDEVAKACLADSPNFKAVASEEPWKTVESGHLDDSVVFIDTQAYTKSDFAMTTENAGMTQNMGEAELVCDTVSRFLKNGVSPCDIGIMCVYRKQVDVIRSILDPSLNIEINSVDQYQGRDKSVVIWSLVWTNTSNRSCELLRDQRRVNVALTRAKHKLVLIGCAESMRTIHIMKRLLDIVTVVKL